MKKNITIFLLLSTVLLFSTGAAASPKDKGLNLLDGTHGCTPAQIVANTAFDYVFILTKQPQSVSLGLGQKVTFSVGAVGHDLSYRWYYRRPTENGKRSLQKGTIRLH